MTYDMSQVTSPTNKQNRKPGDPCHTLAKEKASRATVVQPMAFSFDSLSSNSMKSSNPHSGCNQVDVAKTLDTTDPHPSKNQGGMAVVQPMAIQGNLIGRDAGGPQGAGVSTEGPMYTLTKADVHGVVQPMAICLGGQHPNAGIGIDQSPTLTNAMGAGGGHVPITNAMAVRRLTPTECERLQGFPDSYTAIPWKNKPVDQCPDGPRYKALGNSMAVPVMRWIGERIQAVEELMKELGQ